VTIEWYAGIRASYGSSARSLLLNRRPTSCSIASELAGVERAEGHKTCHGPESSYAHVALSKLTITPLLVIVKCATSWKFTVEPSEPTPWTLNVNVPV
jgi:hypothetical protein